MGWGWYRRGYSGRWGGLSVLLLILVIMMLTRGWGGMSWIGWMILFMVVIPFARSFFNPDRARGEWYEKQKREGDVVIIDKPKREPAYGVGDDGELVELHDDDRYEGKPKRRQSTEDDLEYL
jgi:hypothetical protein